MTDLMLKGGRVIDPASGRDETADVAFGDGKVSDIGPDLPAGSGETVLRKRSIYSRMARNSVVSRSGVHSEAGSAPPIQCSSSSSTSGMPEKPRIRKV